MIAIESSAPLKIHVWILVILNAMDGLLTYIGISLGVITEGNPLLSSFSPLTILAIKLLLSLLLSGLLLTSFIHIQSQFWRYFLIATNTLYSMILLIHAFWLTLLFT